MLPANVGKIISRYNPTDKSNQVMNATYLPEAPWTKSFLELCTVRLKSEDALLTPPYLCEDRLVIEPSTQWKQGNYNENFGVL